MHSRYVAMTTLMAFMLACGCQHRHGKPLDEIDPSEQAILVSSEGDKKRLKEIHERIEQLMMSIEYQQTMADRYTIVGDFSRVRYAQGRIRIAQEEIAALKAQRSSLYAKAAQAQANP